MPNLRLPKLLPAAIRGGAKGTKRLISDFADNHGLVYFGYVSQRSDDHHIVRGLTVSTKHTDNHYCIGTVDGYDVVFVERSDLLRSNKRHTWHILEIDLKSARDLPHCFIGSGTHGKGFHELLTLKYPALQPLGLNVTAPYPPDFLHRFTTYSTPAHAVGVEQIITPEVAAMLASHFVGLVIEITGDALYIYSEKSHLTSSLLATMLKNGIWLAEHIDQNSRQ